MIDHWDAFWDRPSVPARPLARRPGEVPGRPAAPRRIPFDVCLAYEYDSALASFVGAIVPFEMARTGDGQVVVQGGFDHDLLEPAVVDALADIESLDSLVVDRPITLTRSLPQVRELLVTSGVEAPGVDVLRRLPNLRSLCLGRSAGVSKIDLRVVATMPHLAYLRFDAFAVSTIEPLATATGLRRVRIENQTFESIAPLTASRGLEFVAVGWWKGMDRLGDLVDLEYLELNEGTVSSLRPFRRLGRLQSLIVFGRRLRSLAGIEGLGALEELFLYDPGVDDLSALSGLPRLRRIRLDLPSKVADFAPLGRLPNLEELIVNFKGVRSSTMPRLADLSGLRSLRRLALTRADGTGWRFLLDLPAIERLLIYGSLDSEASDLLRRRFPGAEIDVRPVQPQQPRIELKPIRGARWAMRGDLRTLFGVETNLEAESRLMARLEEAEPDLLERLELDSDPDSVGVVGAESDVQRVARLLGIR